MAIPLLLQKLHIESLRCHRTYEVSFETGLNVLLGNNGCGKTTLLEAIYLMTYGRSFRQAHDPHLLQWGSKQFCVSGSWQRFGPLHASIVGEKGKKRLRLQGRLVHKRQESIEALPVLVDAPQAARLIEGLASDRRRWIDALMLFVYPQMQHHYQAYMRCLMQRSRLLRGSIEHTQIDAWEQQAVMHGGLLRKRRQQLIDTLNDELKKHHHLCEHDLSLRVDYTASGTSEAWLQAWKQQRQRPAFSTRIGFHCDRLSLLMNQREIRLCGSRGQQRLASVALRLAECDLRAKARGVIPLLLLDDCLEALDSMRQQGMLDYLADWPGQIIVTAPNHLPLLRKACVHSVE